MTWLETISKMLRPIREPLKVEDCAFYLHRETVDGDAASNLLAYYGQLRNYVEHEDGLINSRLTWSLTIDGFLLAVYGIFAGKAIDGLTEIHKTGTSQPLTFAIAVLLLLQVIVAAVGTFVSFYAAVAIIAAHNALEHLTTIAHGTPDSAGGLLRLAATPLAHAPPGGVVGGQLSTIIPTSGKLGSIAVGQSVTIDGNVAHLREDGIVADIDLTNGTFTARFTHAHLEGAPIAATIDRRILLPKITGGGDPGQRTGGAREYYVKLPQLICFAWLVFAILAALVLVAYLFSWHWFPSYLGPATVQAKQNPLAQLVLI